MVRPFLTTLALMGWVAATAQSLSVMTYNVRVASDGDGRDAWPIRRGAVANTIAAASPNVFVVQEALPEQVAFLNESLPGYDYVGIGRDGAAGGEHSAIFYLSKRYDVVDESTFWLSPTPDTVSIAWGAASPRIATWARLQERSSGGEFLFVNTHLDHKSATARSRGLALIEAVIDSLAEPGLPVVLVGDLNAPPETPQIRKLRRRFDDAFDETVGKRESPAGTFVGFDGSQLRRGFRIDYILTRPAPPARVGDYRVIDAQRDGRYLSDHLPVVAEVSFGKARRRLTAAGALPGEVNGPAGALPVEDAQAEYGRDYLEQATLGFGVSNTFNLDDNSPARAFAYSPGLTIRASKNFGVSFGAAFRGVDVRREHLTASTIGLAGRFYGNGGNRAEIFLDIGPTITFFDGVSAFGAALAPGFSFTGNDRVRLTLGIGGLAYVRVIEVDFLGLSRLADSAIEPVLAPSLGLDLLLGRQAPR